MDRWLSNLLFILVIFFTNIVQAITSFAGTALAMPFSIALVGYNTARPVLNAIALLLCLYLTIRYFKDIDWKFVIYIVIFAGIGLIAGMLLRQYLYSELLLKIYGLFVCLLAGLFLISKKGFNVPIWLQIVLLIIGGFIHGLFVSGGPLLVLALQSKVKEKEKFRATLSFVWVLLNSVLLGQDLINQVWNIEMLILLAISVPTVIVSIIIGKTIFKKLNNDTFMKFAYLLLFISGFFLLR